MFQKKSLKFPNGLVPRGHYGLSGSKVNAFSACSFKNTPIQFTCDNLGTFAEVPAILTLRMYGITWSAKRNSTVSREDAVVTKTYNHPHQRLTPTPHTNNPHQRPTPTTHTNEPHQGPHQTTHTNDPLAADFCSKYA